MKSTRQSNRKMRVSFPMGLSIIAGYLALYEFKEGDLSESGWAVLEQLEELYPGILQKAGWLYVKGIPNVD
jgi:hypothetical protein